MKLYLSLLSTGKFGKVLPKQRKTILTLSNENNRLSDLINDLLIMNKIEAVYGMRYRKRFAVQR